MQEVGREQHLVDGEAADDAGICPESIGQPFTTSTEADKKRMEEHEDTHARPLTETALATPISDVGRLRVCRYSTEPPLPESRIRLSRQQSADLMGLYPPHHSLAHAIATPNTSLRSKYFVLTDRAARGWQSNSTDANA
ncbi:hypothetical protein GCM10020255_066360 [Rhodococcus baikonurensis]